MKETVIQTNNPSETEELGARIGSALEPGMVLALIGDLGAGKTTLTKGIARGLEVSDLVHSPTFNLIHEHHGRIPVYHFDLYRLTTPEQLEDLGYEDYFYGEGTAVVEWPEKIMNMLPADHIEIRIKGTDDARTFEIKATGDNSASILSRI
ncbi:MAG TPA: tRNA (adenosine(37)-N6)-threonylcarbamoyltransferase complex ATPase subunit type 1 TsaE [Armatimonadota bacterium]|jgi:tRNA threonylcarbamoyladenosine biosynthesis protein TsaE